MDRHRRYRAANLEKVKAGIRRWRAANPGYDVTRVRLRDTGWTAAEYRLAIRVQEGKCAICGDSPSSKQALHADHDHETGVRRGLLCGRCNRGLGFFKDDAARLLKAVAYLDQEWSVCV